MFQEERYQLNMAPRTSLLGQVRLWDLGLGFRDFGFRDVGFKDLGFRDLGFRDLRTYGLGI